MSFFSISSTVTLSSRPASSLTACKNKILKNLLTIYVPINNKIIANEAQMDLWLKSLENQQTNVKHLST